MGAVKYISLHVYMSALQRGIKTSSGKLVEYCALVMIQIMTELSNITTFYGCKINAAHQQFVV